MRHRGIWISFLVVVLAGMALMIVWGSRRKDGPPASPGPRADVPPPAPAPIARALPGLSNPPTDEEMALWAKVERPRPPVREGKLGDEAVVRFIRENIAVMVGEGSIERIKPSLLSYTPEELVVALDDATVAVVEKKHADVPPSGRCLSAWLLGKSRAPGVSGFLAAQLASEAEVTVRLALVGALQFRDDEESCAALSRALSSEGEEKVRVAAAYALASHARKSETARRALVEMLASAASPAPVRTACARALARVPCDEAARALVAVLGSGPSELRLAAARSLGGQAKYLDAARLASAIATEREEPIQEALRAAERRQQGLPSEWPAGGCQGTR